MAVSETHYSRVQVILHWLIALMILIMIMVGLFMVALPKESELAPGQESVRAFWFLLHKSMGMTVAILIVLRLGWRLTHKAPPLPDYVKTWQKNASTAVHGLLYVLMVAIPFTGYLQSMFSEYDTKFWGIVVPRLAEADESQREQFSQLHEVLAYSLIALLLLHVSAALKHRLAGNEINQRMSLFRRDRSE
ncbi:cytochrome b [Methylophaga sp.]|uniref:cytochrome b n=1 Tax=Methylophaga sp. TaxID=2024840 RepID=UPI003F6A0ABD